MRKLALIAVAGLVLAGCGSSHTASPAPAPAVHPHYPVVVHSPLVLAIPPRSGVKLQERAELLSPTRLGIVTAGSGSCPWVPNALTVLGPHTIRIHLSIGGYRNTKLVTHRQARFCTADLSTTAMRVAIDPKEIDVHRPLTLRLFYDTSSRPDVRTAAPLKS